MCFSKKCPTHTRLLITFNSLSLFLALLDRYENNDAIFCIDFVSTSTFAITLTISDTHEMPVLREKKTKRDKDNEKESITGIWLRGG